MSQRLFGALVGGAIALGLLAPGETWARTAPPAPEYAVLDETGALSPSIKATLQRLLTEHQRVTGEQLVLAIFSSPGEETAEVFTRRIFDEWKIGASGRDNGALLALFPKEARVMAGSGLDDVLGEEGRSRILDEKVTPELQGGDPTRAATLGILEILRAVHSPLVSDGMAEKALRAGGFQGSFRAREWSREPVIGTRGGWLLFLAGLALFGAVLLLVLAAEAHFTSSGWYRPSPWRLTRWKFELWNAKSARSSLGGTHGHW